VKSARDICESVAPGRYLITRKVEIAGRRRLRRIECNNPAYGLLRLEEWEEQERRHAAEEGQLHQARRRILVALEQAAAGRAGLADWKRYVRGRRG
jgi:hypothetical protein